MWLLFKSSLFKIKKAIGRFLSVVLIVALGTGFFAGLREASPDMIHTIDKYFDDSNLMDFKVASTMGLNDNDIKSLEELDNVDKVIPTYSLDVMSKGKAIRVHAIEDDVNEVVLKDGRMPKKSSECLAEDGKYKIGETINFELDNLDDFRVLLIYNIIGILYHISDKSLPLTVEISMDRRWEEIFEAFMPIIDKIKNIIQGIKEIKIIYK